MLEILNKILTWVSTHPELADIVVFIVALLESFVLVGIVMPGVIMMFMFGALIGSGHLPWTIVFWVMAGAITGDALSYWLGYRYRQHLQEMWPFRRYPKLFSAGTQYFYKHGGKSVFFGRFVGFIRPIIAVIAGMLEMPLWQFMTVNVLSAVLWAVLYLVPGVIFSASLSLAAEVAGRLVVVLITLLAAVWILVLLTRSVLRRLQPLGHWLVMRLDHWRLTHSFGHRLLYPVFDPVHGRWHEHLVVIVSLWGGFLAWGLLLYILLPNGSHGPINQSLFQVLQSLHTPLTYKIMVFLTQLGSLTTLAPIYALLAPCFLRRRLSGHYALLGVMLVLGEALVLVLKTVTDVARPFDVAGLQAGSFPSGHVLVGTLFYGTLAVILASRLPAERRWPPYVLMTLLLFTIAFSRLYLGAHWLSDVVAAFVIAIPLVIIGGIVVYRLPTVERRLNLWLPSLLALVIVMLVQGQWRYPDDLLRYQPPTEAIQALTPEDWLKGGWQKLPLYRDDLLHEKRPFNLQWLGSADAIQAYLNLHGWQRVHDQGYTVLLHWLNPSAPYHHLPIPNHIHGIRYQDLLFVKADTTAERWQVLRLWRSDWRDGDRPYWIGGLSWLEPRQQLGVHYLKTIFGPHFGLQLLEVSPPLNCVAREHGGVPMKLCRFTP